MSANTTNNVTVTEQSTDIIREAMETGITRRLTTEEVNGLVSVATAGIKGEAAVTKDIEAKTAEEQAHLDALKGIREERKTLTADRDALTVRVSRVAFMLATKDWQVTTDESGKSHPVKGAKAYMSQAELGKALGMSRAGAFKYISMGRALWLKGRTLSDKVTAEDKKIVKQADTSKSDGGIDAGTFGKPKTEPKQDGNGKTEPKPDEPKGNGKPKAPTYADALTALDAFAKTFAAAEGGDRAAVVKRFAEVAAIVNAR
jgi:hypothetical protein